MSPEDLGKLVERLRLRRGWAQPRLAEAAGISVSTISRVERGGVMHPQTAALIFEAFRDTTPPLRRSQAVEFLDAAGLDPAMADHPKILDDRPTSYRDEAADLLGHRLEQLFERISRMMTLSGDPAAVADLCDQMLAGIEQHVNIHIPGHINEPPGDEPVEKVVERPPVDRGGYTEHRRIVTILTPKSEEELRQAS